MKTVWQWDKSWKHADSQAWMGVQKNKDGTGFRKLESGDDPQFCNFCQATVSNYPHTHTKADYDASKEANNG